MGALGSLLMAAAVGRLNLKVLRETLQVTTRITATVLFILICAQVFALAFRGLRGEQLVHDLFAFLPGGVAADIWFMMLLIFVLGFFIEWIEISYIAVPLFLPIFDAAGVDLVWLCTMICLNLQTSFLTPPFGWALFFLKGVAPPEVTDRRHLSRHHPLRRHAAPGAGDPVPAAADRHLAAHGDRVVAGPCRAADCTDVARVMSLRSCRESSAGPLLRVPTPPRHACKTGCYRCRWIFATVSRRRSS